MLPMTSFQSWGVILLTAFAVIALVVLVDELQARRREHRKREPRTTPEHASSMAHRDADASEDERALRVLPTAVLGQVLPVTSSGDTRDTLAPVTPITPGVLDAQPVQNPRRSQHLYDHQIHGI